MLSLLKEMQDAGMMRNVISYIAAMSASYGRHQEQVQSLLKEMRDVGVMHVSAPCGPEVPLPTSAWPCAIEPILLGAKSTKDAQCATR